MKQHTTPTHARVPQPAPPPEPGELPRTLTFALTAARRAAVLRVLRGYSSDRAEALCLALGVEKHATTPRRGERA